MLVFHAAMVWVADSIICRLLGFQPPIYMSTLLSKPTSPNRSQLTDSQLISLSLVFQHTSMRLLGVELYVLEVVAIAVRSYF